MPALTVSATRSARLGLRATAEQETILRLAANVARKSLTDFVLESACQAAEQILLDQRAFTVSTRQFESLIELFDRPERANAGLINLCSRRAPWQLYFWRDWRFLYLAKARALELAY